MKTLLFSILTILAFTFSGCISKSPEVHCTKVWEGHYYTVTDLHDCVERVELKDGESIWVLSNETLKRLLKNTKEEKKSGIQINL